MAGYSPISNSLALNKVTRSNNNFIFDNDGSITRRVKCNEGKLSIFVYGTANKPSTFNCSVQNQKGETIFSQNYKAKNDLIIHKHIPVKSKRILKIIIKGKNKNKVKVSVDFLLIRYTHVPLKTIKNNKQISKSVCSSLMEKPYDILFVACYDWANTAFRFTKSLKSLGLNVQLIKKEYHVFDYPEQGHVLPSIDVLTQRRASPIIIGDDDKYIQQLVNKAKVVVFHAETFVHDLNIKDWKKTVMIATGSTYRRNPTQTIKYFSKCSDLIVQCPDLLGKQNIIPEHLVYYPVDVDYIQPNYERGDTNKIIIGHFPSTPHVKGTGNINDVIIELENNPEYKDKFSFIGQRLKKDKNKKYIFDKITRPWQEVLDSMKKCDILIETLNLDIDGKQYGEWGNTCIEASSSGCIVLTNTLNSELYVKEYGSELPIYISNSKEQLHENIKKVINLSDEELLSEKKRFRQWVEDKHSFFATGRRMWDRVFKKMFPIEKQEEIENNIMTRSLQHNS